VLRSNVSEGTRSNYDRVRGSSEQSHDETVRLVETADIAAARFPGNLKTDHAVECAYKITDDIRLIPRCRESQTSIVEKFQFLRQTRRIEHSISIEQRSDRLLMRGYFGFLLLNVLLRATALLCSVS
jgi:hypothetical protein